MLEIIILCKHIHRSEVKELNGTVYQMQRQDQRVDIYYILDIKMQHIHFSVRLKDF